jgi:hypothetical protein
MQALRLESSSENIAGHAKSGLAVAGGYARAAALTAEQRTEIAKRAADKRWRKKPET